MPIEVHGRSQREWVRLAAAGLLVSVPHEKIADAYNNVGVTADADVNPPSLGDGFDGAGSSYSAEALTAAGVTPGKAFTVGDVTVRWPDAATATPNNVVANGQSIRVNKSGGTLGILAAATYGPASGEWIVHYTDGSEDTVRLSTPDWTSAPPDDATVLVTMPYRNNAGTGQTERRTQLFYQSMRLDPAKTVFAVTLPALGPEAVRGQPALPVFDLAVG